AGRAAPARRRAARAAALPRAARRGAQGRARRKDSTGSRCGGAPRHASVGRRVLAEPQGQAARDTALLAHRARRHDGARRARPAGAPARGGGQMTRSGFLAIELITHRAAIVGRAIDQRAQTPLPGVEVVITSGPAAWTARLAALHQGHPDARPDRMISDGNGFFRWLDLPAGSYALRAALPGTRYGVATGTLDVVASGPVSAALALLPTAVTGLIKGGAPAQPLAQARVRFADSDDTTYSAA